MQYSFDVQEAVEYGLNESIMIWNFRFWIVKNKANNRHFYEGRTWTYNTHEAFQRLFPFWTKDQVRRVLEKLLEKNVLIKGNFNANSYNKTSWYAFADEGKFLASSLIIAHMANLPDRSGENANSMWQKREIDVAETGNGVGKKASSITDIKPDVKPFLSLPSEEKKEFLKKVWSEKKLRSDCEKYFLFHERKNWKGVSNIEADIAWWENGFLDKNPLPKTSSPEISKIREKIKRLVGSQSEYDMIFAGCPIEKVDSDFVITVKDSKALNYQQALAKINVTIEVK
jgi:hypothetical protein